MWMWTEMVPGCQPDWISQSAFIFPGDFMPGGRQSSKAKARFTGNQSKRRCCHYSTAITLCNQHLLHNDTLKLRTCLLPLLRFKRWAIPNKNKASSCASCALRECTEIQKPSTHSHIAVNTGTPLCAHTHTDTHSDWCDILVT